MQGILRATAIARFILPSFKATSHQVPRAWSSPIVEANENHVSIGLYGVVAVEQLPYLATPSTRLFVN